MGILLLMGSPTARPHSNALNYRLEVCSTAPDDTGSPDSKVQVEIVNQHPNQAETAAGSAFTWVVVLLWSGTIVPMLHWWSSSQLICQTSA